MSVTTLPDPWHGLVDDAAVFPPGNAALADAVSAFCARDEPLVRSLVVRDTDLPALPDLLRRAAAPAATSVPLTVVLTGGAGQVDGPVRWCAGREDVRLASLDVALRDPSDLVGNARRVVAAVDAARAAGDLDEEVPVHVELPQEEPGHQWLAAADEVAAAELRLKLRTGGVEAHQVPPAAWLAGWVDAALDREMPFRCTAGLHRAVRHTTDDGVDQHGFLNLLLATRRAFDGAGTEAVVATLEDRDAASLAAAARETDLVGARRWFTSFGSCSVSEPLDDLTALGLLERP